MDFGLITNIVQWTIWGVGAGAVVIKFIKNPPKWLSFAESPKFLRWIIVLGVLSSFASFYFNRTPQFKRLPQDELVLVEGKTFVNEVIDVDGKLFDHCQFVNIRFNVAGKHNTAFTNDNFYGTIVLHTDSSAAAAFVDGIAAFGLFNGSSSGQIRWVVDENERGGSLIYTPPVGTNRIPDSSR